MKSNVENGKNKFGDPIVKVWVENEYGYISGVGNTEAQAWRNFERAYEQRCNGPIPTGMLPTGR